MKLRTALELPPSSWHIDHSMSMLALGSCFADRLGQRLSTYKFPISVNPWGIVFHPLALSRLLTWVNDPRLDAGFQASVWEREGEVGSFWLHGNMNGTGRESFEEKVGQEREQMQARLDGLDVLLVTWGTAIGQVRDGMLVANNHRFPGGDFASEMASVADIVAAWRPLLEQLRTRRPALRVLLTVSPVRHVRSGIVENGASKAILRAASHELAHSLDYGDYFPGYEFMVDDLRDYRFYERDLIHPNDLAVDYIWDEFARVYFSETTRSLIAQLAQVHRDLDHRPRNPDHPQHQSFLESLHHKIARLEAHFDMAPERTRFSQR